MPRVVHISTDEVYGPIALGSFDENSLLTPTSPYAASKASADLLVQAYIKTHRFPAIIIRACNNFGPFQYPEKVIPLFITNLIEGKKVPLYSQGENSREWMYVEDTCEAILLILNKGKLGSIYNLGSSHELTNLELTRLILGEFGLDESWISFVKDRPAHDLRYSLRSEGIGALGFRIQNDFRSRLKQTVGWYRNHPNWWKGLKQDVYTLK